MLLKETDIVKKKIKIAPFFCQSYFFLWTVLTLFSPYNIAACSSKEIRPEIISSNVD